MKATIHECTQVDELDLVITSQTEVELPEDSLSFLQKHVGGYIDIYHHKPTGRDWVLNDEGLLLGMPLNPFAWEQGVQLVGTIIEIHGCLD